MAGRTDGNGIVARLKGGCGLVSFFVGACAATLTCTLRAPEHSDGLLLADTCRLLLLLCVDGQRGKRTR